MISFAPNVLIIMFGRALSGFCVGVCSLALPVYLGETVQPEVRGTLGLLPTTFGNVGESFDDRLLECQHHIAEVACAYS